MTMQVRLSFASCAHLARKPPGPVTQQTADSYDATFDTNVLGTLLSMKHELRVMQAQRSGRDGVVPLKLTRSTMSTILSLENSALIRQLVDLGSARVGARISPEQRLTVRQIDLPTLALPSPRMDVRARAEIQSSHICGERLALAARFRCRKRRSTERDRAMPAWQS